MGLISPHFLVPEDAFRVLALVLYGLDGGILLGTLRFWWRHDSPFRRRNFLHIVPNVFLQMALLAHLGFDTLHRLGRPFQWWVTPTGILLALLLPLGHWGVVRTVQRRDQEYVVIDGQLIKQNPERRRTPLSRSRRS